MGNSNQLVGDNKFTLFPILGVERSFPFPGKVATGKGSFPFPGKAATGKGFINFGKAATGKGFINFGKGKDPFLSQERSSLQLGKVSSILGKVKDPFLPFLSQNGQKESFER